MLHFGAFKARKNAPVTGNWGGGVIDRAVRGPTANIEGDRS